MRKLLLAQTRRWKIPSGIPSGIKVANKTGETSSVEHDMAIVYGKKKDYIICVFSNTGSEDYALPRIRNTADRKIAFPTSEQKAGLQQWHQSIERLMLPRLEVDPIRNSVSLSNEDDSILYQRYQGRAVRYPGFIATGGNPDRIS